MPFNENLKKLRTTCGFSQEEVANVLGVDRSAYSYYESGKTEPSIPNLVKIARMYRVSTDTLVDNEAFSAALSVNNETEMPENTPAADPASLKQCSSDERALIALYRTLEDKQLALAALENVCRQQTTNE